MVTATEAATSRPRKMRQAGVEARQIAGSSNLMISLRLERGLRMVVTTASISVGPWCSFCSLGH